MIHIDMTVASAGWPDERALRLLARRAVAETLRHLGLETRSELSLLFTGDAEIRALNARWRGKDKATNVLSFPAAPVHRAGKPGAMLGDIVLAFETVKREAQAEGKRLEDHVAHLIVHGLLHLLGYDHEDERQAAIMEDAERAILHELDIADPYAISIESENQL
jgi:probable rRNA maturation factor